jgi:phage-related protein
MSAPTFPDIKIGLESRPTKKQNVSEVAFGDGYEQIQSEGINNVRREWQIVFDHISRATYDTIDAFLADKVTNPFYWQSPLDTSPRLWKMVNGSFQPVWISGVTITLSVTFRESFDLV